VNKFAKIAMFSLGAVLMMAVPAFAQEEGAAVTDDGAVVTEAADSGIATGLAAGLGAVGAGLVCIGSGGGIGRLAASAFEGMARQPEMAGQIQTAMIIAAALIEGFTFFALFICMS
jgi:F-type H+-transporting ATPase subunit c